MIDINRFHWALALGLAAILCFGSVAFASPRGVMALAGDTSSPGGRLYLEQMVLRGLKLEGATVEGYNVSRLKTGNLKQATNLVIERDVKVSSIAPNLQDWTIQVKAPRIAATSGIDIYQTRACVNGVGVTRFGLLSGLLDSTINGAIANGFNGSFIVSLVNLVGGLGIFDITTDQLWSETVLIEAPQLAAFQGIQSSVTPKRTSAEFLGSCIS